MTSNAPTPADAEDAKSRILNHMNKDHSDSLALYLAHTRRTLNPASLSPKMTDISFSDISIVPHPMGPTIKVPIEPPLGSWMEARGRLETMDKDARTALGRTRTKVTRFVPPNTIFGVAWVLFLATFFSTAWNRENFAPGALFYETVGLKYLPSFGRFCYDWEPTAFWFAVVMHVGETVWFTNTGIKKANLDIGPQWLWWAWVLDTAFEGFSAMLRFNAEVKRVKDASKKDH